MHFGFIASSSKTQTLNSNLLSVFASSSIAACIVGESKCVVKYNYLNGFFIAQVFVYTACFLFLWMIFRKSLIEAKAGLGIERRTAQHYTVMLENLPVVAEFDEGLFLERTIQNRAEKYDIAQMSFTYDVADLHEKYTEYMQCVKEVTHIECYRKTIQFRAERDGRRIDELEMNNMYPSSFPLCFTRCTSSTCAITLP